MHNPNRVIFTAASMARAMGISRSRLYRLVYNGTVNPLQDGPPWIFSYDEMLRAKALDRPRGRPRKRTK